MTLKTYELIITEMADGAILVKQNLDHLNLFIVTGILDKVRLDWLNNIDNDVRFQSDIQDVDYSDNDGDTGCGNCNTSCS